MENEKLVRFCPRDDNLMIMHKFGLIHVLRCRDCGFSIELSRSEYEAIVETDRKLGKTTAERQRRANNAKLPNNNRISGLNSGIKPTELSYPHINDKKRIHGY